MIGKIVGKYRIAEQIGEGGMGVVYRAEHVVLGSPAAVKVLLPQWTRNRDVVDRFFMEARTASSIRHIGIVDVFDYGLLPGGQAFIAMELLIGMSLGDMLDEHRLLPPPLAASITGQILAALDAAHVVGVIHRDLKPDNIQLIRDASAPASIRAKVLDFGIAKLMIGAEGRRAVTISGGGLLGTPSYMSPEQCLGRGTIDSRSDLYATGCILFEMLTGHPPFEADGSVDIVSMHLHDPPPRLRSIDSSLPIELEQLVERMLAKDPAQRTPSAAWALAALERVPLASISTITLTVPAPPSTGPISIDSFPALLRPPLGPDAAQPRRLSPVPFHATTPARAAVTAATGTSVASADSSSQTAVFSPGDPDSDVSTRRRMLPFIVILIAIVIAVIALVLIGRSAQLKVAPLLPSSE